MPCGKGSEHLLNTRAAKAALGLLRRQVRAAVPKHDLASLLNTRSGGAVQLPGFSILTPSQAGLPQDWLLPQTAFGLDDVVYAYETFVDRELGLVRDPAALPESLLKGARTRLCLGYSPAATHWFTPALRLLVLASRCSTLGVASHGDHHYSLTLRSAKLEISPGGCYSNFAGRVVPAAASAQDVQQALAQEPQHTSHSPLIQALAATPCDRTLLSALSLAITRGMVTEDAARLHILSPVYRGEARSSLYPADASAAALQTLEVLERSATYRDFETLVEDLVDAAVPGLFSLSEFTRAFQTRAHRRTGSRIRQDTVNRWRAKVETRLEELRELAT